MLPKHNINPNKYVHGQRYGYRPSRKSLRNISYGVERLPPAIEEENESKILSGVLGETMTQTEAVSNIQRFAQATSIPSKENDSGQYLRFEALGSRTENASNKIISTSGMFSQSNARAQWQLQTKPFSPEKPGTFWTQSVKLNEQRMIETNPMVKYAGAALGFIGNTNHLIEI